LRAAEAATEELRKDIRGIVTTEAATATSLKRASAVASSGLASGCSSRARRR